MEELDPHVQGLGLSSIGLSQHGNGQEVIMIGLDFLL